MDKKSLSEWSKAIFITLTIYLFFSVYLYIRRGYYNLYIINKVLGSTAVIVAGLTLLFSPLVKKGVLPEKILSIRRQLGLLALGSGLGHAVISTVFLTDKFKLSFYMREWIPITFGAIAIIIWLYLAYVSRDTKIAQIGLSVWKKYQSIGAKLAITAILMHLVLLKYKGWLLWFQGKVTKSPELANPTYPPASLFVLDFILAVIIFRIINWLMDKFSHD